VAERPIVLPPAKEGAGMATPRYYLIQELPTAEECLERAPEMLAEIRETIAQAREVIEQSHEAMDWADKVLSRR
jgi:hypothetical protein